MSLEFSEELLSAYLDGEVSPDERDKIQQLLQDQPEIQAKLDQLKTLREQVRALPRLRAPEGFVTSILEQVESHSERSSQPKRPTSFFTEMRQLGRRPLAAVVVVVFVSITLVYQWNQVTQQAENRSFIVDNAADSFSIEFAEQELEQAMLVTSAQQNSLAAGAAVPMEMPEFPKPANRTAVPLTLADSKQTESFALSMSSSDIQAPKVVALKRETIQQHLESLAESPDVGDELSILTSRDESPILVDFTVVDVQKSLGTLQVLLKNHNVEQIELDDQAKELNSSNSASPFDANQKMVAVYLHLAEPELENVLNQVVALDATLIVPEEDSLSFGIKPELALSFQQNGGSQPLAGGGNSLSTNSGTDSDAHSQSGKPSTLELAVIADDSSTMGNEKNKANRSPQNYYFDLGLMRSNRHFIGNDSMPQMQSVAATSAGSIISTGGNSLPSARPPAPQLPVRFDGTLVETLPAVVASGDQVSNGNTEVPSADQFSAEDAPAATSKRVKALLILRQEKPELDRSE